MNLPVKPSIFSIIICLLLSACLPDGAATSAESVKVVIADRTFKIPKGYFDGKPPSGKDTESVVLEYALPDFSVLPPHLTHREARQELINQGLMRSMLLEAERNKPPVEVSVKNLMRGRDYKKQVGVFYGLEKYVRPKDTGKYPTLHDDFFYERNAGGNIISFLFCSAPDKDKIPGCSHTFVDKGLMYNIHWPIDELPHWQHQRRAAISFIDSLEITKTEDEQAMTLSQTKINEAKTTHRGEDLTRDRNAYIFYLLLG